LKEGKTFFKCIYKSCESSVRFNIRSMLNIIFILNEVKGFFFTRESLTFLIGYKLNVLDSWLILVGYYAFFLGSIARPGGAEKGMHPL